MAKRKDLSGTAMNYLVAYAQASEQEDIFKRFERESLKKLDQLNRGNFKRIFRRIAKESRGLKYIDGVFSETDFEGEQFAIFQGTVPGIRHECTDLKGIRKFWISEPLEQGYYKVRMKAVISERDPRDYFIM